MFCEVYPSTTNWALLIKLFRTISCSVFAILDDTNGTTAVFTAAIFEGLGSPTLLCILGSRMFFNLKEAGEHGVNVGTNWSSYSHSAIRFDEPQLPHIEFVEATLNIPRLTKCILFREDADVGAMPFGGTLSGDTGYVKCLAFLLICRGSWHVQTRQQHRL